MSVRKVETMDALFSLRQIHESAGAIFILISLVIEWSAHFHPATSEKMSPLQPPGRSCRCP